MGAFFDVPPRFHILSSPMYDSLPSLIVDYNPSHKLLTQLHTLTNEDLRCYTESFIGTTTLKACVHYLL